MSFAAWSPACSTEQSAFAIPPVLPDHHFLPRADLHYSPAGDSAHRDSGDEVAMNRRYCLRVRHAMFDTLKLATINPQQYSIGCTWILQVG
jgi:hypothetical protein